MRFLRAYGKTALALLAVGIVLLIDRDAGIQSVGLTWQTARTMLGILPPILILVHLFDAWVPKEVIARFMGANSGFQGFVWAALLGAFAAGPLYVAFPVVAMLLRKGVRPAYAIFLLGAWSTIKAPIFLYELSYFGPGFTLIHVATGMAVSLGVALLMERAHPPRLTE